MKHSLLKLGLNGLAVEANTGIPLTPAENARVQVLLDMDAAHATERHAAMIEGERTGYTATFVERRGMMSYPSKQTFVTAEERAGAIARFMAQCDGYVYDLRDPEAIQ